jgi:putative ABC transport system substrate-binding protein
MKRRSLLAAPALLPVLAHAQQPPLVGIMRVNGPAAELFAPAFRREMGRLGFEEGKNYRTQVLFADGDNSRLPALAADLVKSGAGIIVPFGHTGTEAAQAATKEIPIVAMADDLVAWKLVASMARPGGNTTGVSILAHELDGKRTEVLHELVPRARRLAVMFDEGFMVSGALDEVLDGARKLGLSPVAVAMSTPGAYEPAVSKLESENVEAVQFLASPLLNALHGRFMNDMARLKLPALYEWPETVEEGGLVAYGPRVSLVYRQVAVQVAKVLKGAKPADLPIEQPTTFVLAINARAARTIGLQLPEAMLLRADVVVD